MSSCAASRCQHSSSIAAQSLISDLSPGVTRVCGIETNLTHHIVTENSACVPSSINIRLYKSCGYPLLTWWHAVLENASRKNTCGGEISGFLPKVSRAMLVVIKNF